MDEEKIIPDETVGESEVLPQENEPAAEEVTEAAESAVEEVTEAEETPAEEAAEEEPSEDAPADEQETEEEAETPEEESSDEESVEEATRVFSTPEQSAPMLDGIRLARELCEAIRATAGRDGFHGGVRPDNISVQDGKVKLGEPLAHGVGEFTPQELEYMAPELFWDGSRSAAADVYSIGLVLYSVYNHGLMPFWPVDTEATPNMRAAALQRRMNREELVPPASADSELSAIILRALAFAPEERWNDAEELCNALSDCAGQQLSSGDIGAVLAGMIERSTRRAEKKPEVSSPFVNEIGDEIGDEQSTEEEEPIPKVKVRRSAGRLPQILVYLALGFAIVAIVLLLRRCVALDEEARVTPTPPVAEVNAPGEEKIISGNLTQETEQAEETEIEPEPTPEPTPEPVGKVEYVVVRENVSWSEAVKRCEEMGGTLAMPTTYEEFQTITAKCEEQGLTFVWLNAKRNSEGKWVDDQGREDGFFFAWGDGEPSAVDTGDGAAEDYFLLWNRNGRWCGNDSRENPLTNFFGVYGGKIGFVCRTVTYESVNITDLEG